MNLEKLNPGKNAPNEVNIVIEIPAHSDPVKYEACKDTGALIVDRFMSTAMFYPCNYGYVPQTLSDDGDPVDALVITPIPLINGAIIKCRPVALLKMTDEKGIDAKVLAVPTSDLTTMYDHIKGPDDVPQSLLQSIAHFFEHYKDLENGKWAKIDGWYDVEEAKAEIMSSIDRYKTQG